MSTKPTRRRPHSVEARRKNADALAALPDGAVFDLAFLRACAEQLDVMATLAMMPDERSESDALKRFSSHAAEALAQMQQVCAELLNELESAPPAEPQMEPLSKSQFNQLWANATRGQLLALLEKRYVDRGRK